MSEKKPKLLVIGSLNMDLTEVTKRFPENGETVFGMSFRTSEGGKGANQAVQAARLGADVTMIGAVGADAFGKQLIANLKASGVKTEYIQQRENISTGVASIQVRLDEQGSENRIMVIPGANMSLASDELSFLPDIIRQYDMLILQHEIPREVNCMAASIAAEAQVPVMLNPAPFEEIPASLLENLTYISPNEHEAQLLTGIEITERKSAEEAIKTLLKTGVKNVLITLGKNGCAYGNREGISFYDSIDLGPAIDPTAAGDSFIGAFSTAVSSEMSESEALRFANLTAGLTVTRAGAQASLPTLAEVMSVSNAFGMSKVF